MLTERRAPGRYQELVNKQITQLQKHFKGSDDPLTYRPSYLRTIMDDHPIWALPFDQKPHLPDQQNRFWIKIYNRDFIERWLQPKDAQKYSQINLEREIITSPILEDEILIERVILEARSSTKNPLYTGILCQGRTEHHTLSGNGNALLTVDAAWEPILPLYYIVDTGSVREQLREPYPLLYQNAIKVQALD